jgi:hypothetical protein
MCKAGLTVRWAAALIAIGVFGCGVGSNPEPTPIGRAYSFLQREQVAETSHEKGEVDYAGDWPQYFVLDGAPSFRVRDVSPFIVSFIHHALTRVSGDQAEALGLDPEQVDSARGMRQQAIAFLRQFEAVPGDPARGTFGFWPYHSPTPPSAHLGQLMLLALAKGPLLNGTRTPINLDIYPEAMAIPTDADVTATTFAALLDDELLDGGSGVDSAPEKFFSDWRDTGDVPLRFTPPWLPSASGAFLTWLNYGSPLTPNDVDLVVNANVLFALGRYGRLETPGVAEAIALIRRATEQGLYRTHPEEISLYYPDNYIFQYAVARAYHEGPVPALRPAVEILADDLEQSALEGADGAAHWDKGAPVLNTAFAVLTLLNAGRSTELIARGVRYLEARQDALTGDWPEGVFFIARTDRGIQFGWVSHSFTTAMALEALCRFALLHNPDQSAPAAGS